MSNVVSTVINGFPLKSIAYGSNGNRLEAYPTLRRRGGSAVMVLPHFRLEAYPTLRRCVVAVGPR